MPEAVKHKEAIILAGGFGTRLRTVLPDLPKCMAPVHGKPFLEALLCYLWDEGIEHIILSLGYRHQHISDYVRKHHADREISLVLEEEPLGTGGAIALALDACDEANVFILNGDTFFNASLRSMEVFHADHHADCTVLAKPMDDASRYGTMDVDSTNRVTGFREKEPGSHGLINGGVYLLNRDHFPVRHLPKKFSFEQDYLSAMAGTHQIFAQQQDCYFIDIGIPADYERAQREWSVFFPDTSRHV
ncbi:MAG: nucleotidyltransferase family protein [Chitinophagaceae bacterium]|jgi:D-glycero-alpha-D-manno-heptose 1-phosphate guanylyltransferase|nr:nucleotidyltransferase family protein [Chitinophagaceae bacterium]